jgi:adenylosuccinate lyase
MPHKKNPILTENLTGLARLLRGYGMASMENVALWHERDISHSSVERVVAPDATIVLDFMFNRFLGTLHTLVVNEENIRENMKKSYNLFYSQRLLVELAKRGYERDKAYELVQKKAMKAWEEKRDFQSIVRKSSTIKRILSDIELDSVFDIKYYFRNIDYIYQKSGVKHRKRGKH